MDDRLSEWHFDFGLYATRKNQVITQRDCDELLKLIVKWAEAKSLLIGGGYRQFEQDEGEVYR
jgi:hypothetical protein